MGLISMGGSRVAEQRGGATELRPLTGRRDTMPKEALSSNRSDQGLPQGGVELSFDELARAMAVRQPGYLPARRS